MNIFNASFIIINHSKDSQASFGGNDNNYRT